MVDCLGQAKTSYRYAAPGRYTGQPSLISQPQLCEECNKNQATKIQELNSFEPSKESDFHSELEAHKQQLDDRYKLCCSCRNSVKHHLNVQAMDLKTFLLGSHLQQSKSTPKKMPVMKLQCGILREKIAKQAAVFTPAIYYCHRHQNPFLLCWLGLLAFCLLPCYFVLIYSPLTTMHVIKFIVCGTLLTRLIGPILPRFSKEVLPRPVFGLLADKYPDIFKKEKQIWHFDFVLLDLAFFLEILVFWLKTDCGWRITGAAFCCLLCACSFLFSLLLYSRVLGTKKKKSYRSQLTPRQPSSTEERHASDSEMDTTIESEPSRDKTAAELDHNLNGLTLGLPTRRRRNGYNTRLSPKNSSTTGSFWNLSVDSNSKESPLVSMRQRPLIVPATLHFSGLQQGRFPASHTRQATNVTRGPSSNSHGISDDDDSPSDAIDEENSMQNSSIHKDKGTKPRKTKRRITAQSSKTGSTGFLSVKTFLLFASVLLNVYFIVLFTEWPVRILHSLWKRFQR